MEDADRRILDLLVEDGRASYTELGKAVGLSTSAVHQRVRRMEERGVLRGFTAVVDHAQAGRPLTAFVEATPLDNNDPDDVPERLRGIDGVVACYSVAGDANYLLMVRVATPQALEALIAALRARAHVSTKTTVVLSTPWERR
ncbi:Lrp/AsnC family transcriptional regulator [Marihabitans asiaticum]|uniref:AsnC family transcriptional regulator n=1 Tax=Marihabitans asiaticum TaxID=415218 RepID=A0A560W6J3_9MICO|nr:Lrp/AsnC family transcriptional regulator [Marihabitans asiaticum]TWD13233.1 AsnC family transcriptional regulator [Marihabitans asiaticum]